MTGFSRRSFRRCIFNISEFYKCGKAWFSHGKIFAPIERPICQFFTRPLNPLQYFVCSQLTSIWFLIKPFADYRSRDTENTKSALCSEAAAIWTSVVRIQISVGRTRSCTKKKMSGKGKRGGNRSAKASSRNSEILRTQNNPDFLSVHESFYPHLLDR